MLEHVWSHHVVPSTDQYNQQLPYKSSKKIDVYYEALFEQLPLLWDMLDWIANDHAQLQRCGAILASLLVTLIGNWNSESRSNACDADKRRCLLHDTRRLVTLLAKGGYVVPPVSHAAELLECVSASHVVKILHRSVWKSVSATCPAQTQDAVHALKAVLTENMVDLSDLDVRFFGDPS